MDLPHVVMFLYNDETLADARVWKEAETLHRAGYPTTVIALKSGSLPDRESRPGGERVRVRGARPGVIPGAPNPFRGQGRRGLLSRAQWVRGYVRELLGWRDAAVRTGLELIPPGTPVVWHGHDLTGLMPAVRCAKVRPGTLVYDAHELYVESCTPATFPWVLRRMLTEYEGWLVRRASQIITVSESIAGEFVRRYRVQRPRVVRNCPPLGPMPVDPLQSPLRHVLGVQERPVLLHHGQICEGRGVRETIAALDHLPPEVALVLLGYGELIPAMLELQRTPAYANRLYVHPRVPYAELTHWVAGADIAVMPILPIDLNSVYCAPNKLFESLAAGVPVVASDFPDLRSIVLENDVGLLCEPADPASIAGAVRQLLNEPAPQRLARRQRCRQLATSTYCWERESETLLRLYGHSSKILV